MNHPRSGTCSIERFTGTILGNETRNYLQDSIKISRAGGDLEVSHGEMHNFTRHLCSVDYAESRAHKVREAFARTDKLLMQFLSWPQAGEHQAMPARRAALLDQEIGEVDNLRRRTCFGDEHLRVPWGGCGFQDQRNCFLPW